MEEFTCSFVLHISPQRLSGSSIDSIDVSLQIGNGFVASFDET